MTAPDLPLARRIAARRHTIRGIYAGERFLKSVPRRAILRGDWDAGSLVRNALTQEAQGGE